MSNKKTIPKAVIYCRVSSKSQEEEGHGLQSQETRCRDYAAAKGYDVVAVFPDTISGGGDFMKRPGMVALLSFLDAQPDDNYVVIFDDLKRFARDTRFHLDLRDTFRQRGATIECLNFKLDDSPEGQFIETIMAAQGELERKQNGRQVAQKMKARMQNGYWVHQAPIGYRYQNVKGHGKLLVRDEPLATLIAEAFDGFASGRFQAQSEIKRFFERNPAFPRNKQGIVPQQRVTDVLTNPLYTGYICSEHYGLSYVKGQHDPLISLETFDKVQARRNTVAKAPKRANIGDDFALRGFVTCGDCGVPLKSSWSTGYSKRYPYYLCQTKGCDSYGKSVARDKVEGEIGALIKDAQPTPGLLALAKAMFQTAWDAREGQAKEAIQLAKSQIRDVETQIETLLDRIVSASSDSVIGAYEKKLSSLEADKARLQDMQRYHRPPEKSFEEKLELLLTFLANPWKIWETGHITMRRTVLKLMFSERISYHRNQGARTAKFSLPFKALGMFKHAKKENGAACPTRTDCLGVTKPALYQVS